MNGLLLICNGLFDVHNFALMHIGGIMDANVLSVSELLPGIQILSRLVHALVELRIEMGLNVDGIMLSDVSIHQGGCISLL